MKSKLKGCPICGEQPIKSMLDFPDEPEPHSYACYRKNHVVSASGSTQEEAALNWNKRVEKKRAK